MILAVDFDGTIVEHKFPEIGKPVPDAIEWLKLFNHLDVKLILWTMRSDEREKDGNVLTHAVDYLKNKDIKLWGINSNPDQAKSGWSTSPKQDAQLYLDDAAVGCPLMPSKEMGARQMVDWSKAGPMVLERFGLISSPVP